MLIAMMYHFIHREDDDPIFRGLHGIDVDEFAEQLTFLSEHAKPLSHRELLERVDAQQDFTEPCFTLTFDDGFRQHYSNALPVLKRFGLEGSFYIPTKPLHEQSLHILEKQRLCQYNLFDDYRDFLEAFYESLRAVLASDKHALAAPTQKNIQARANYLAQHPFYSNEERFYRYLRDEILNQDEFNRVIHALFAQHYDESEAVNQYCLGNRELAELISAGMHIGGHSHSHPHLDKLDNEAGFEEISTGLKLLEEQTRQKIQSFSYPFGSYNNENVRQLQKCGIRYAYTTGNRTCVSPASPWELTRIDAANFDSVKHQLKAYAKKGTTSAVSRDPQRKTQALKQEGLC